MASTHIENLVRQWLVELRKPRSILVYCDDFNLVEIFSDQLDDGIHIEFKQEWFEFLKMLDSGKKYDLIACFGPSNVMALYENPTLLLLKLSEAAEIVITSFPVRSMTSKGMSNEWPSYYTSTLHEIGITNYTTFGRNLFWEDGLFPPQILETMITFSKSKPLPCSDFPLDCLHPTALDLSTFVESSDRNANLRLYILDLFPSRLRRFLVGAIPKRFRSRLRGWLRK